MKRSSIYISVAFPALPRFLFTSRKKQITFMCLFLLLTTSPSYSQPHHPADYALKVKTDNGVYKGLLTGIMDSSIEIMDKRTRTKTIFSVNQINLIKVKKPYLTN